MHRTQRVVFCVPCGRRRYLKVLLPYIQRLRGIVDSCQLWLNTRDVADIAFCEDIARNDKWYDVRRLPQGRTPGKTLWRTVHLFYPGACEPNTVYVKCDDDIVYMGDAAAFQAFLDYRLDHPEAFLLSANVVNNPLCAYHHQQAGKLPDVQPALERRWDCPHALSGPVAEAIHRTFLARGANGFWFDQPITLSPGERVAINLVAWLGEDFAKFGGRVPETDEDYVNIVRPRETGQSVVIHPTFVACHFAFEKQRAHMDATPLLRHYETLAACC